MKLILCKKCQDVVRLIEKTRYCECGSCGGYYQNHLYAVYFGQYAIPIGFANRSLLVAVNHQPNGGLGETFTAFVIPKNCETFKKITNDIQNPI